MVRPSLRALIWGLRIPFLLVLLILAVVPSRAGAQVRVHGRVYAEDGGPVSHASVQCLERGGGTMADERGIYSLRLPPGGRVTIAFRSVGYAHLDTVVELGELNELELSVMMLREDVEIEGVQVASQARTAATVDRIVLPSTLALPSAGATIEALLRTYPGVRGANELSSQYSVRGGSFDENLVYIDGMQVYRPSLIRGGNQEGLSVINPDMVSRVEFSSGAFPANLGDRMSSALNITYRTPRELRARVDLGLLESRLLLEGATPSQRLSAMLGVRYKSTLLLLNTTDSKGDYQPAFFDLQLKSVYRPTPSLELGLLLGYMRNEYRFLPTKKETTFGSLASAFRTLTVYYEGGERDLYSTLLGSLYGRFQATDELSTRLNLSVYHTNERETFDILGEYWLSDIRRNEDRVRVNDSLANRGIGGAFDHARNHFNAVVSTLSANAHYEGYAQDWEAGLFVSHRYVDHDLNEWHLLDSAGYTLPCDPLPLEPYGALRASQILQTYTMGTYALGNYAFDLWGMEVNLHAGARLTARERGRDLRFSPRGSLRITPHAYKTLTAYFASGLYYQYPFYRDMRDRMGILRPDLRPQRSIHYVLGTRVSFPLAHYPFNVQMELYRKELAHLIPYTVDNLSLRYEGQSNASGFIQGVDLKVNAMLVPGVESWLSLSLMQARMRFDAPLDRAEVNPPEGVYFAMPSDQRFAASIFLQDYFPFLPSSRVHLAASYATGLPFTPPQATYDVIGRLPSYQRVDVGFTKIFKDGYHTDRWLRRAGWLREFAVSLEVLNLLNFLNTTSYMWVSVPTDGGQPTRMAVPNFLTARCINFRLVVAF